LDFSGNFQINQKCFPLKKFQRIDDSPIFPLPYDLPITPYAPEDSPFFMDYLDE
jgi:tyrosyl-DNA phosphodiesterase-1